jgi:hypothetical protein
VSRGGTGLSATPTNGQLLTGNGTGYTLSTLNGGPGVGITNNAGSITITATGTGFIASVNAATPLLSTGTTSITISLPSASNGQLLIGNGSGFSVAGLTAGTGVSITNSAGSITISASTTTGLPTVTVTASTAITAAAGINYVLTGASAVTVTLPASPTISDTIYVTVANGLTTNVIARNGKPIQGIAEDMTLNAPYASAQLRFTDNTEGWVLV